jgi:PhnB protein
MLIEPYLMFNGRCQEAIDLYSKALGAELAFKMTYSEAPEGACGGAPLPAGWNDKIMHCSLKVGETMIMMSDGNSAEPSKFSGITLSVSVPDEAHADKVFNALGEGGSVCVPLGKTFFSPRFGMVADKFGVSWMVIVPQPM